MNLASTIRLYGYGTHEGLIKAWDTRGRGRHLDPEETKRAWMKQFDAAFKGIITDKGLRPTEPPTVLYSAALQMSRMGLDSRIFKKPVREIILDPEGAVHSGFAGLYQKEDKRIRLADPYVSTDTLVHEVGHHIDYSWFLSGAQRAGGGGKRQWFPGEKDAVDYHALALANRDIGREYAAASAKARRLVDSQINRSMAALDAPRVTSPAPRASGFASWGGDRYWYDQNQNRLRGFAPAEMNTISHYSLADRAEWFAEAWKNYFSHYPSDREMLADREPKTYQAIDDFVKGKFFRSDEELEQHKMQREMGKMQKQALREYGRWKYEQRQKEANAPNLPGH